METTTTSQLQLRFKRNDITSFGTTHRKTIRVLPSSKAKSRQKVVVGDKTGVATCFGVGKHHDVKPEFATPKPDKAGAEVTSLTLYRDQIFLAAGNRIAAFTKKGKPFYINETSLSEALTHLEINTPYQCVAGDFVLTLFRETRDDGFYMSPDRINDICSLMRDPDSGVDVYIGGQDRTVRCVRKTEMLQQMGCEAPVTAIEWNFKGDTKSLDGPNQMAAVDLVYGTVGGSIGGLRALPDGIARRFSAIPPNRLSSVVCVRPADLTADGVNDIVVTRDDGGVELHSFEMNPDGTPVSAWAGTVGELVQGADCGNVTTSDRPDIVVSTFSGKVISFTVTEEDERTKQVIPTVLSGAQGQLPTAEGAAAQAAALSSQASRGEDAPIAEVLKVKITATMDEIAAMKKDLAKKKNQFAGQEPTAKKVSADKLRAVAATFSMRDKIFLDESGVIVITLELDTILDTVNVHANILFEAVNDSQSNDETRVSVTPLDCARSTRSKFLATYRTPQESQQKNITLRLRPTEGFAGQVTVYVTPRTAPKSTLKRVFDIPALSLHQRIAEDTSGQDPTVGPNITTVTLTGNFSIKDAHAWVYRSFFDVPQNVTGDECRLTFKSTHSGVLLYVRYRRGEMLCASHNLSALATLRDYVTREAAARKVNLSMDTRLGNGSLDRMLEAIDPFVAKEARLNRSVKILEALKELQSQEPDTSFMAAEYRSILEHAEEIQKAHESQPQRMQYVLGILDKLYSDRSTFRDCAPATQTRLQEMHQLVTTNYSLDQLKAFFEA